MKGNRLGSLLFLIAILLSFVSCTSVEKAEVLPPEIPEEVKTVPDITGWWEGSLPLPGDIQLLLQFEVVTAPDGYSSFLSIRQQAIDSLQVHTTVFDEATGSITFDIAALQATFTGLLDATASPNTIEGTFSQGGALLPLVLEKNHTVSHRLQEVVAPYPYISEDVSIPTANGFSLAGTITRPDDKAKHPCVILVTGSGLQDRNEEILGHKPFLVIADALTKAGIVVIRYDDRGFAQSGGDGKNATSLDFADDAASVLSFLKTKEYVQQDTIGVLGHSEGAIIAGILAADNPSVAFVILLSGPGLAGMDLVLQQTRALVQGQGFSEEQIEAIIATNKKLYTTALDSSVSLEARKLSLEAMLMASGYPAEKALEQVNALLSPWYLTFLALDPVTYFSRVSCPVLIVSGTKDLQVPTERNVSSLQQALASNGNMEVSVKVLDGLNHLLQPAITGQPTEYETIETTIDPSVLSLLSSWILSVTN
ncbi:lysophospholipase [Sphaerochaeta pleomorpha str. Grapes]|uniref:Lysophospholipase n=1 Tax=Sphaerochaeta pleomorpha (strain ATCC BAA-1885 / DSM 22778 / Grapes) TaxID=158190 RepID=G8QSL6_SPHPG|nr:alpha/beta hydrolase [Sphaerochaeta pleomorpha]AEV28977.1 lysophospholipase [Sphaerochaeta pleomorpha str. Grapes]